MIGDYKNKDEKSMTNNMIYEHKIQYYETDQMKIVHHSNYIRWFEEARVFVLEAYDMGYDKLEALGIVSPVLAASAEYKSMSRFGESVCIEVRLLNYNGIKFSLAYTVRDKENGVVRCTGETRHCFLDEQGKPLYLKRSHPEIHEMFEKMHSAAE